MKQLMIRTELIERGVDCEDGLRMEKQYYYGNDRESCCQIEDKPQNHQ